jgi:hypothetical protein
MASSLVLPVSSRRLRHSFIIPVMICTLAGCHATTTGGEAAKAGPKATSQIKVDQVGQSFSKGSQPLQPPMPTPGTRCRQPIFRAFTRPGPTI